MTAIAAAIVLALTSAIAPASAINWLPKICTGYTSCSNSGHGNGGYAGASGTSYWTMYTGHNCTNYVAYREINNGAPAKLDYNLGDATTWGTVAKQHGVTVNNTPAIGSVAWFSSGHVAYVEAIDGGKITVSEDNWNGDFDWRQYYISDVTGFIHFADVTSTPEGRPFFVSSVQANGDAYAKAGLGGEWIKEYPNVVQTAAAADSANGLFYGALTADGTLLGKQGLGGPWVNLAGDVRQFSLASDPANGVFVAIVTSDGTVYGKQGLGGTWIALAGGATQVAISSDSRNGLFVGVVRADGVLFGKQGVGGEWVRLIDGSTQVAVTSDPTNGVFFTSRQADGTVYGKQGLGGTWIALYGSSMQVATPGSGPAQAIRLALTSSPTPVVSGATRIGSTLTAVPGMWAPAPVTLSFQWLRSGSPITGATSVTYTLTPADVGATISVRVTGTKAGYATASVTSAPTAAVTAAGSPTNPTNPATASITAGTPKITGKAKVAKRLTCKPGTWKPAGISFAYQWKRNGNPIPGATKPTYKLTKASKGKRISVRVTGTLPGANPVTKTSATTRKVK